MKVVLVSHSILDEIVAHKRAEVETAKRLRPTEQLRAELGAAPPVRDFVAALRAKSPPALIAEVKKASPSGGLLRPDFDPAGIARTYEQHGAACISCLTDEAYFQGTLDDFRAIRAAVSIPVLRKDFILDRYQVLEARTTGADCVLLIAECLDDCTLRDLYFYASELGMEALVEVYEPENLDRALKLSPPLLGINNRNLKQMVTDLDHSIRLSSQVPDECLLVSESGIHRRDDVLRLQQAGIRAMLVGETFMRSADLAAKVDELLGR